jgi:hypothetical protein
MEDVAEVVPEGRKKRSQSDKIGRIKYQGQILGRIERRLDVLELQVRTLLKGLEPMLKFDKPFLQRVCCEQAIDVELLDLLREAGPAGLLARDLAVELHTYRQYVTRRVKAMNRRLVREIGRAVVEKRGARWALSSFAVEAWDESEPEALV